MAELFVCLTILLIIGLVKLSGWLIALPVAIVILGLKLCFKTLGVALKGIGKLLVFLFSRRIGRILLIIALLITGIEVLENNGAYWKQVFLLSFVLFLSFIVIPSRDKVKR